MNGASCSCLGMGTTGMNTLEKHTCQTRVSPATYVCVGCGTFITPGEEEVVNRGVMHIFLKGHKSFDYHHHLGCRDLLLCVANKYVTNAYGDCNFVDCLDEWLMRLDITKEQDRKILELGSGIIERLNNGQED